MWRTERGCLHWLCKSVIFKQSMLFHFITFLTTSFSWNILVSTSITASPLTQKKVHTQWCFELLFLLIFLLELAGERIWHHFTVGPVAHYHAAPHQENHTGRREWSPLIFLLELLTVLHPTFFLPWASHFNFSSQLIPLTISPWLPAQTLFLSHHLYCCFLAFLNPLSSSLLWKDWSLLTWTLSSLYSQWYHIIWIRILVQYWLKFPQWAVAPNISTSILYITKKV